jgi:DNA primase catalytic subunit
MQQHQQVSTKRKFLAIQCESSSSEEEKRLRLDTGDELLQWVESHCPRNVRYESDGPSLLFETKPDNNNTLKNSNGAVPTTQANGLVTVKVGPQEFSFQVAERMQYSLVMATQYVYWDKKLGREKPANKYGVFRDKHQFLSYLWQLLQGPAQQSHFPLYFELIRGPVKFYADLDAKGPGLCNLLSQPLKEAEIIREFTEAYHAIKRIYLSDDEEELLLWSGSSRGDKVSLHVVAQSTSHYWPDNCKALNTFMKSQFLPYLAEHAKQYPSLFYRPNPLDPPQCIVDKNVYTVNRVMRAQFCSKADDKPPRPLYPYFPNCSKQPTQAETFAAWTASSAFFIAQCLPYLITLEPQELEGKTAYINRDCAALLEHYYQQPELYPWQTCFRMLCMNEAPQGATRIVGIQFKDQSPFMLHSWYQMQSCDVFRDNMRRRQPYALHMGDRFSQDQHYKEIVFDMDANDFVRFCGCGDEKRLCTQCWTQMQGAYLLLQHYLVKMHAYSPSSILWVFSGNRGLHCLVNDRRALLLDKAQRETLFAYLYGCTQSDTTLWEYIKTLQKHDQEFLQKMDAFFHREMLEQHSLLDSAEFQQFCFQLLARHFGPMMPRLRLEWEKPLTSVEKWKVLQDLQQCFHKGVSATRWIIFKLFFPMIDKAPFTTTNHTIKTPFAVHAKTAQLALPLDHEAVLGPPSVVAEGRIGFVSLLDLPHGEPLRWEDAGKQQLFERGRVLLDAWTRQYALH